MNRQTSKKPVPKMKIFSSSSFAAATVLAVLLGIIMIALGRAGYTKEFFTAPPPGTFVPIITPSGTPPGSTTPGTSTGPTSSPQPTNNPSGTVPANYISGSSMGSPDAPVTIIEYADYQCSICQQFALTTEKDLERVYIATGKVRFIFKNAIVYGDESLLAAQAAEAAAEQNKFWPYHDLLMQGKFSSKAEDITLAKLQTLAQIAGLNMDQFNSALSSGKFKDKVMQDDAEGRALGVKGTPTFFVNGNIGTGDIPFDAFQKYIEQILQGMGN
jgi:protein-disulfide isomerase